MERHVARLLAAVGTLLASSSLARADGPSPAHRVSLQVAGGVGYFKAYGAQHSTGLTFAGELRIGGIPLRGLACGGGVLLDHAPSTSQRGAEWFPSTIAGVGLFVDYSLFAPTRGFHVDAFLGWGALTTWGGAAEGTSTDPGPLVQAGIGYELPLGHQWSYGVRARFLYAPVFHRDCYSGCGDTGYRVIEPAIVGTLTWH